MTAAVALLCSATEHWLVGELLDVAHASQMYTYRRSFMKRLCSNKCAGVSEMVCCCYMCCGFLAFRDARKKLDVQGPKGCQVTALVLRGKIRAVENTISTIAVEVEEPATAPNFNLADRNDAEEDDGEEIWGPTCSDSDSVADPDSDSDNSVANPLHASSEFVEDDFEDGAMSAHYTISATEVCCSS